MRDTDHAADAITADAVTADALVAVHAVAAEPQPTALAAHAITTKPFAVATEPFAVATEPVPVATVLALAQCAALAVERDTADTAAPQQPVDTGQRGARAQPTGCASTAETPYGR